jgi:hypothetical protein
VKALWNELALEELRSTLSKMSSAKDTLTYILKLEEAVQLRVVLAL